MYPWPVSVAVVSCHNYYFKDIFHLKGIVMSKFSFEFATMTPAMEETLKSAILPVRRAVGRNIAEAAGVPMNTVQAKRLGISSHLAGVHMGIALTEDQKRWSEETTERWVNNVIAISRMHVMPAKPVAAV
jgi:hypothetical protein